MSRKISYDGFKKLTDTVTFRKGLYLVPLYFGPAAHAGRQGREDAAGPIDGAQLAIQEIKAPD
jgi:hypothetical protein